MKKSIQLFILILCFVSKAQAQDILLKANHHYDSENAKFKGNIEILIKRNKIVDTGNNLKFDTDKTKVIDLGDATLLPGLIDSHTHLFIEEILHPDYTGFGETVVNEATHKTASERTLEAAHRAKTYLQEGFTSIRDLGNSADYLDVILKKAINNDLVEGPRLFVSGPGIAASGGQINNYNASLAEIEKQEYEIINGKQEAIESVRNHVLRRVDVIKLYADNIPNRTELSIEELTTVVNEAKNNNLPITAHAITNKAIWKAAMAGVNSVEHAYTFQDSTLTLLKEKKIAVVPTYSSSYISDEMFKKYGIADKERRNRIVQRGKARQNKALQRLYKSGLKIVFGSDFYSKVPVTRGKAAKNSLYALIEAEIPLEKALQYATYNAGELFGLKNKIGVLKIGGFADIIAIEGSLEDDYKLLEEVQFIMKNGKIIHKK